MDPPSHRCSAPRLRPVVDVGERPTRVRIVSQTGWDQRFLEFGTAEVRMRWQQDSYETTPRVLLRGPQARADLPIDVLALPRTPTHQHNRYSRVGNELVPDLRSRRVDLQPWVYVAFSDRPVYKIRTHVLREQLPVLPVLLMKAHEHFVSCRCHSFSALIFLSSFLIPQRASSPSLDARPRSACRYDHRSATQTSRS